MCVQVCMQILQNNLKNGRDPQLCSEEIKLSYNLSVEFSKSLKL